MRLLIGYLRSQAIAKQSEWFLIWNRLQASDLGRLFTLAKMPPVLGNFNEQHPLDAGAFVIQLVNERKKEEDESHEETVF